MIRQYVEAALRGARYDKLEDGTYYGEVPRLRGVLAVGTTLVGLLSRILRQAGVTRAEWERA